MKEYVGIYIKTEKAQEQDGFGNKMKYPFHKTTVYEYFASFATRRISTLTKICGHLKGILVIKLLSIISFMYILTYLYILAEISAYHLQLKCMGGHFFFQAIPNIESTIVLIAWFLSVYQQYQPFTPQ